MTLHIPFDNSFARLPGTFYASQMPDPVPAPRMIAFNADLARLLGITPGEAEEMAQIFAGNRVPDHGGATVHVGPVSLAGTPHFRPKIPSLSVD